MDRKIDAKRLRSEKMEQLLKIGAFIIVGVMVVALGINLLQPSLKSSEVIVSKVSRGDVEVTISAMGRVVPAFEEVINSPITSKIIDVYKHSGESVMQGEPILKLDLESVETEYMTLQDELRVKRLQLKQLQLNNRSQLMERTMELEIEGVRQRQLKEQLSNEIYLDSLGSGTPSNVRKSRIDVELGEKELNYKKSELESLKEMQKSDEEILTLEIEIMQRALQQKQKLLDKAQILSPRTSVLSFVNSQIGEQVNEGSKIATLTDISEFKIEGEISNSSGRMVKIGGEVIAVVDNKRMLGVVSNVNPVAVDNIIEFTVQLENGQDELLRSGINCDLYIVESREANRLRIANIYDYRGEGLYELFVVEGDMLVKRSVVLGVSNFEYVVVKSGVVEGEEVVTSDLGVKRSNNEIKFKR